MKHRIYCPKCGRILGDAEKSFDGVRMNCPKCKKAVKVGLIIASHDNYITTRRTNDDKSE